mgnify:CR=1 FL=1
MGLSLKKRLALFNLQTTKNISYGLPLFFSWIFIGLTAQKLKALFLVKYVAESDLTVIDDIGLNIQRLFFQNGIKPWEALSACSVQKCQALLDAAGENYKMHDPKTWPSQARMAHSGQWKKLKR